MNTLDWLLLICAIVGLFALTAILHPYFESVGERRARLRSEAGITGEDEGIYIYIEDPNSSSLTMLPPKRVRIGKALPNGATGQKVARDGYRAYLASDAWQVKRRAALTRADHRCQLCNSRFRLDVHHRTYDQLGRERDGDLIVLCHDCHSRHHGKLDA